MSNSSIITTLIASVTDGYNEDDVSVFSGNSSSSLTTLDLSAYFTGYAAVRLRVTGAGLYIFVPYGYAGTLPTTAAGVSGSNSTDNPYADSRGYVDTFTNNAGKISWKNYDGVSTTQIQLISHIEDANAAPTVTGTAPTTPSVVTTNPAFSCTDDSGVVQATIDLEWTSPSAVTTDILINGAWQTGFSGTIAANATNGYDVEVTTHPDMEAGSWSATATVEDAAGLVGTDTWAWTVNPLPTVTGQTPTDPGTPIDDISFTCTDDSGVVQATIDLEWTDPDAVTVDILINGAWQAGYNGTITANGSGGFDVEVTTHPAMHYGVWSATATVEDAAGGTASDTWNWTVASAEPELSRTEPNGITTTEPTKVGFFVTDDYGLDVSSLRLVAVPPVGAPLVAIDGGVIQSGWAGSIQQLVDLGYGPTIIAVSLTTFPALMNGARWSFEVDCDAVSGYSL